MKDDLKDGTEVKFDFGSGLTPGVVRGIAFASVPFLGKGYIVELTKDVFPSYPYRFMVVNEVWMR